MGRTRDTRATKRRAPKHRADKRCKNIEPVRSRYNPPCGESIQPENTRNAFAGNRPHPDRENPQGPRPAWTPAKQNTGSKPAPTHRTGNDAAPMVPRRRLLPGASDAAPMVPAVPMLVTPGVGVGVARCPSREYVSCRAGVPLPDARCPPSDATTPAEGVHCGRRCHVAWLPGVRCHARAAARDTRSRVARCRALLRLFSRCSKTLTVPLVLNASKSRLHRAFTTCAENHVVFERL